MWLWYAFGLAALIAFIGDWTLRVRRNRQKGHQKPRQKLDDPVPFMMVLREYGVGELGGLYFYVPVPARPEDQEARAWLRVLKAKRMVVSGPWRLEASRAPPWLKTTHPRISSEDGAFYEIYRVKKDSLAAFV